QQGRTRADIVREHLQALEMSSEATRWFRKERQPQVIKVSVEAVLRALNRLGIRPVLMGTYGINGYRDEPRATQDVDVLVTKREVRKAIRALEEEFPYLEVIDSQPVARFRDPVSQKIVIDVMKPAAEAIKTVFRNTVPIGTTHRIPELEMAIA